MWNLEKYNNNTAIIDEYNNKITYAEIADIAKNISEMSEHRTLVVCLCRNSIGSIVGYISFINNRIVPMMLNANLDSSMLENILALYLPVYIWLPTDMLGTVIFKNMESVFSAYDYSLCKTGYQKKYPLHNNLGLLLATSGSTGSPKFVRQSYANILANAKSIVEYLNLDETEKPITTLPMHYTYGLSIINSHLLVGATILVTEKSILQKDFWTFFKEQSATSFGGVPYTYEVLDKLRFTKMNLPSLRTMTQAGGKIIPKLHERFAKYADENNLNFIVMYGQCEATARMGYLPSDKAVEKCGSIGIAIPGGEFHLVDENGMKISQPHISGELVYRGKNVTLGYAECGNDLLKGDECFGILHTGDIAEFDEDGYYYIVGRKKRFLKIYGNRVNLDEIDRMVKSHFEDIDCASAGYDDHMFIFITDIKREQEIKSFVVQKTKLNPAAFKIMAIETIPKNDAGKVLYTELERLFT